MKYVLTKERLSFIDPAEEIRYIESEDFILGYLEVHEPEVLGLDTETTGLDFVSDDMVMLQIGTMDDQFIVDTRYYDIEFLKPYLESMEILKVLHNVKFDYKMILQNSSIVMENVYDTMLADKVLNCGRNTSAALKACSVRYLGESMEKDPQLSFLTHTGPFKVHQIVYGAKDVTHCLQIREKQLLMLRAEGLEKTMDLENKVVLAFGDIEFNGINIDEEKWLDNAAVVKKELDKLEEKLNSNIKNNPRLHKFMDKSKQLDFFKADATISYVNVNWASPKQVLNIFKTFKPRLKSVGAKVLDTINNKPDVMKDYMLFKKKSKLYSSYGPEFLKHLRADNKIHTEFSQILKTGRVSSSKPNMQQVPAKNSYRNCFVVDNPDWVFASSDFSSQELCVIATIAQDPVWLQALRDGKDLHSVCAGLVFGGEWEDAAENDCAFYKEGTDGHPQMQKCTCPEHQILRSGVKSINFGLAYGMSEFALADRMAISVQEAKDLIATYFTTFPKIKEALERFGNFGKKYGYIMTMPPFKRKRYFDIHAFINSDSAVSGTIERASKNTPIQGSSADMTKVAMVYVRNYIRKHHLPVKMVMVVHDQIDCIVHKDFQNEWKVLLGNLMEKAALKIVKNGLLKAETELSPVWKK